MGRCKSALRELQASPKPTIRLLFAKFVCDFFRFAYKSPFFALISQDREKFVEILKFELDLVVFWEQKFQNEGSWRWPQTRRQLCDTQPDPSGESRNSRPLFSGLLASNSSIACSNSSVVISVSQRCVKQNATQGYLFFAKVKNDDNYQHAVNKHYGQPATIGADWFGNPAHVGRIGPSAFGVSLPTQVSVSVTSLVDLAWSPGSAVPRSSVSTAVWHFEYRHEFRHAAERTFTSYMSYGDECRQTNVLWDVSRFSSCSRSRPKQPVLPSGHYYSSIALSVSRTSLY